MSRKQTLLAITNGTWLISEYHAEQLGVAVAEYLNNLRSEKHTETEESDEATEEHLLNNHITLVGSDRSPYVSKDLSYSNASAGSVAVISITGPIMKHDNCGDPGTKTYERLINSALSNPNISAIVLQVDTPGGTVSGTESLHNTIRNASKPIVTLAEDLMASAGYWFGSGAQHVMAYTTSTQIGSIGTMISFADFQGLWEKMGIKFHTIFADESKDKNAAFLEARAGNYKRMREESLNPINERFLSSVKENRKGKLNLELENVLTGKVYVATDALKFGLIDSIGNLNDAIDKAFELSSGSSAENSKTKNTNMKKVTLTAAHSALLALCGVSIAAGQDSVDVDLDAVNAAVAKQATDLKTAQDEVAATKTKLTEAEGKVNTAEQKATDAEAKATKAAEDLEAYKVSHPGKSTSKKEGADELESEEEDEFLTEADLKLAETRKKLNLD